MLFLLNSDYGAMKKTLKLNRFSAKFWASRHKMYITAIFMHVVLEQYKTKSTILILRLRWHWKQGMFIFVRLTVMKEKLAIVLKWSLQKY